MSVSDVWRDVLGTQPAPPGPLVAATAVAALAVVLVRPLWRVARNTVTIAHEGGHALAALLTGRQLTGIRLHSDTSGLTLSRGRPRGPGMVITLFSGYVAPPLLGLAGAVLLTTGHITALLWAALLPLAGMLVMIRNPYGVVSVVATGALLFGVSWFAQPREQAAFAYLAVWFLLLAGVRPVVEMQGHRRRGARASDADQLAGLTRVPALLWVGVFALANLAVLALGAWLLLPEDVLTALTDLVRPS